MHQVGKNRRNGNGRKSQGTTREEDQRQGERASETELAGGSARRERHAQNKEEANTTKRELRAQDGKRSASSKEIDGSVRRHENTP